MDAISSFNFTPEKWFYGDIKIYVLSNTMKELPQNLLVKVDMYSGGIIKLLNQLKSGEYKHA